MDKISLKFINYSPDFKNEGLVKYSKKLFKDIKTKNIEGFEHFGFHELALNFNEENYEELNNFSKFFHNEHIENVIIFANTNDVMNYNAAYNFLRENDLLKNQRINFYFLNSDMSNTWQEQYKFLNNIILEEKTAFLFVGLKPYTSPFVEFIKIIINDIQQKFGYYRALKKCFMICKQAVEKQISFLQIDENNKIIISKILTNNFAFFAESNLFLLLLKGCDLFALTEGYQYGCRQWQSENLDDNLAFQYGYVKHSLRENYNFNIFSGDLDNLLHTVILQSNITNLLFHKYDIFATCTTFPNNVYTYGQFIIDNNKKIYLTHYQIEYEKFDYRISDDIDAKDNLEKYANITLNNLRKNANEGLDEVFENIASLNGCIVNLMDNSEFTFGILISFIYWSLIYESYSNKTSPFDFSI